MGQREHLRRTGGRRRNPKNDAQRRNMSTEKGKTRVSWKRLSMQDKKGEDLSWVGR